jgi:hypothetical protein
MNSILNDKFSRAREIEEAWRAEDWARIGELFGEYIRHVARKAACDFCLPWKLAGLSELGKYGIMSAIKEQRDTELGLPLERYVESCIDRKIRMDAEAIHKVRWRAKTVCRRRNLLERPAGLFPKMNGTGSSPGAIKMT